MAVMRAQVSLMFDDEDLFNNFIIPCKDERRLNGIIVKCLTAYYFNERVRSLVEGESEEEEAVMEGVPSTQSICDSIRASLIMQDYLVEELQQTVDTGVEDVESILSQANKKAESHGFGSSYQTKSGSTILQLEAPKQQTTTETSSGGDTAVASSQNNLAAILCQAVLLMAKDSNNSRVVELLQQAGVDQTSVTPTASTETPRQVAAGESGLNGARFSGSFEESGAVVDMDSGNDFGEVAPEPVQVAQPAEPVDTDASDSMMELFGSL